MEGFLVVCYECMMGLCGMFEVELWFDNLEVLDNMVLCILLGFECGFVDLMIVYNS